MNEVNTTNEENSQISLEKKLDEKRQEINALQTNLKVIEAQTNERIFLIERIRTTAQSTGKVIQVITTSSVPIRDEESKKEKEKNLKELIAHHTVLVDQMNTEIDILSTERIEFAKIYQELENAKQDFQFLHQRLEKINNTTAWMSGSFYVFSTILIITVLAVISSILPWYSVGIIFVSGLLAITIIGALQLRNDKNLSEENFIQLIKETLKHLPVVIKSIISKK